MDEKPRTIEERSRYAWDAVQGEVNVEDAFAKELRALVEEIAGWFVSRGQFHTSFVEEFRRTFLGPPSAEDVVGRHLWVLSTETVRKDITDKIVSALRSAGLLREERP